MEALFQEYMERDIKTYLRGDSEGAPYVFSPIKPEEDPYKYGDTETILYNQLDEWLSEPTTGLI